LKSDWMPTVTSSWVACIIDTARRAGIAYQDLLDAARSAPLPLDQPKARVSIDQVVGLWRAAIELTSDPSFGLHVGEQVRPGSFSVVTFAALASENLRHALGHLLRYQRLVSDGLRFQILDAGESVWVIYHPVTGLLEFSPQQTEAVLATIVTTLGRIIGHDFNPVELRLRHQRIGPLAEYRRVLRCDPQFGAQFDGFSMLASTVEQPLPNSNPELCRLHENLAKHYLTHLETVASWRERSEMILRDHLADGVSTREKLAAMLGSSNRSLQRRLAEEGTGFAELLDKVRHDLAITHLQNPLIELSQLATLLGFSDASAFYRAFRRWSGQTPGDFRKDRLDAMGAETGPPKNSI
jgi:AraC-like DNA-binding protein